MLSDSDLRHAKTWRLRKLATDKRKALAFARDSRNRVAYRDYMIEDLEADLSKIAAHLKGRAHAVKV